MTELAPLLSIWRQRPQHPPGDWSLEEANFRGEPEFGTSMRKRLWLDGQVCWSFIAGGDAAPFNGLSTGRVFVVFSDDPWFIRHPQRLRSVAVAMDQHTRDAGPLSPWTALRSAPSKAEMVPFDFTGCRVVWRAAILWRPSHRHGHAAAFELVPIVRFSDPRSGLHLFPFSMWPEALHALW